MNIKQLTQDVALKLKVYIATLGKGTDSAHDVITAGDAGLRSGERSELTIIADLKPEGAHNLRLVFDVLKGNLTGARNVGTLHDMRFVFLENDSKLLFCTCYDGDWDTYINDFATKIPEMMDLIFGNVEGWPGIKSPEVKPFIISKQITASAWFVSHPKLTVADVTKLEKIGNGLNKLLEM
jgi:hypothetical protein